ncbi:MAG: nucleotidyltransferase domain-containing protein [Herpetosiphon sp.]
MMHIAARVEPEEAAQLLVLRQFPACQVALLGGSVVRGEGTVTSDLDIVVVVEAGSDAPYRESQLSDGWPVELFVHTPASLNRYCAADVARRRPTLPSICADGLVLADTGLMAATIKEEAGRLLARGPTPLTPIEIEQSRYRLTDLLDDLKGHRTIPEANFTALELAASSADFWLALHRQWLGNGKWRWRRLSAFDPHHAHSLLTALKTLYADSDVRQLSAWVEGVLAAAGGPLFEGYRASGTET